MSYVAPKTNFVRPHAKASYIRPMFYHNKKENMHKDFDNVTTLKNPEFPNKEFGSLTNPDSFKHIDDAKEKHIQALNSAHSKMYAEIDKIHNWTATIESECKQKDKKVDELNKIVESQRKVQIDLQMQNENLSTKLNQEIQQRVSVLEKYFLTKELFSTLRNKFVDLQEHFNACIAAKTAIDVRCKENAKSVEDLTQKMNALSVNYSENIVILNNSLKSEKNNNLMLKKLFEQQTLSAEKEHKSLCKLIENYQEEIKHYSQDLDYEKNKVLCLQQEKNELLQKNAELEKSEVTNLQRLEDVEKQLQLIKESQLETEQKYSLENVKVNNLSKKNEELEELIKKQRNDFDEKCLTLKTTINSLENSLSESEQKLAECESEKEELSRSLKDTKKEKCSLENEILAIQKENKELQNKLIIDAKMSNESIDLLIKEKNDLVISISLLKDDLQAALFDKEKLSKECSEKDDRLSERSKEYEIAAAKIKELNFVEEKCVEMTKKLEDMSTEMQLQSKLLASKEQDINEMHRLKLKYDECLIKIKEKEDILLSLSDEIKIKEMKIEELTASNENLSEALITIKEMETDLSSKTDLLISQKMKIEELTASNENLGEALITIKEMESDLSSKNDLLISQKTKIEELTAFEGKLEEALIKIKELESDLSLKNDLLISQKMKLEELAAFEGKLGEALIKIMELESDLSSKNGLIVSQKMNLEELSAFERKLGEALIKIKDLESDLSSKNDLLISQEQYIEEMNIFKQNYDSAVERVREMEAVIKDKTELLQTEEEKVMDLNRILRENNTKLEKLEYENLEIKDCLEKEHESVKICLECEMLKDKVKELDNLRTMLMDTEKDLNRQKLQTSHITKMLSETEENFDKMRIKKEKEIIKFKDTIQTLQHELKILKVEVGEAEKIKYENDKLRLIIEEIKLQNAGDIQRLKAEIKTLKANENKSVLNSESPVSKKLLPATPSEETKPEPKCGEVMEPDSSDEVTIVDEKENSKIPSMYKKFTKEISRKVINRINRPIHQSTPLALLEKRKRAWESESSGSECLEVIFDKNAKKVAGFTPKAKSPHACNWTPISSSGKLPTSEEKRRDLLEITETETPKRDQSSHLAIKSTPQNKKVEQIDSSENVDFLLSKSSVKEVNFAKSPLGEQVAEIKGTPTTPADRKFFKTPLKERDYSFKKPQLQKLWF